MHKFFSTDSFCSYNILSAQTEFIKEIVLMKVGLTIFFIILAITYHYNYDNPISISSNCTSTDNENPNVCPATNTLLFPDAVCNPTSSDIKENFTLNEKKLKTKKLESWRVIIPIIITPIVAVLTMIGVLYNRSGKNIFSWGTSIELFIIFAILGIFELAKEGSGTNRWLNKSSEDNLYKQMDEKNCPGASSAKGPVGGNNSGDGSNTVKNLFQLPNTGDPFINNFGVCTFILISIYLIYIMIKLGLLSSFGKSYFKPGLVGQIPMENFIKEVLIVGILNALTQPLGSWIRKEEISMLFTGIFLFGGMYLHIIIQFIGFLGWQH
jgi:hypothetical protein